MKHLGSTMQLPQLRTRSSSVCRHFKVYAAVCVIPAPIRDPTLRPIELATSTSAKGDSVYGPTVVEPKSADEFAVAHESHVEPVHDSMM
jgi:hypothetical protein